jgi:hypothetical protein
VEIDWTLFSKEDLEDDEDDLDDEKNPKEEVDDQ